MKVDATLRGITPADVSLPPTFQIDLTWVLAEASESPPDQKRESR